MDNIKKYTKVEIQRENVVLFNNKVDSLKDFVEKFVKGQAHLKEDIREEIKEFSEQVKDAAERCKEDGDTIPY